MCDDRWCHKLSKMAAWLENYVVLDIGGVDGNMGGEGKPAYSCGHGGMSWKWALPKSGRSILWSKDESRTGNFSCVEVWRRSKL